MEWLRGSRARDKKDLDLCVDPSGSVQANAETGDGGDVVAILEFPRTLGPQQDKTLLDGIVVTCKYCMASCGNKNVQANTGAPSKGQDVA
jgi:hypothetical protein